jgi:AraC-like DNA-binding protein
LQDKKNSDNSCHFFLNGVRCARDREDWSVGTGPAPWRQEKIEFDHPAELPGLLVVRAWSSPRMWRWFHDTWSVAAMYDGAGIWKCDRRVHETGPGGLSLWQPGDTHQVTQLYLDSRSAPVTTQRVVLIDPSIVERAAEELGVPSDRLRLRRRILDEPRAFRAFRRLHDALELPASRLEKESRLAQCLRLLVAGAVEGSSFAQDTGHERDAVGRVRNLILERCSESLRLDDLAAVANVSKYHLIRAFAKEVGLPPHAFQMAVRITKAQRLLKQKLPAAWIAAQLGFADQSHFIRTFRRWRHVTPSEFAGS